MVPTVTVVVPVLNESMHIDRCLDHIDAQTYPSISEVLVVDGGSTDDTRTRAVRHQRVRLVDNPRQNQAAGLNIGLAEASGQVIVRVDGHCFIPPDYVEACVKALIDTGAAMVGGQMKPEGEAWLHRGIATATRSRMGAGPARFHTGGVSGWVDTVYLGAYWRREARRAGGYFEDLVPNEDAEFALRMECFGGVWFDARISCTYVPREDIRQLAKQYFCYGRGRAATIRRHPKSVSARQLAAPLLVLGLLSPIRRLVGVPYLTLVAGRAALEARRDAAAAIGMACAMPTMHLAWGAGFMSGLLLNGSRSAQTRDPFHDEGAPDGTHMPTVSVVIPAFNAEMTIDATLASVAAQTYRPSQVVVVDDGSTDGTESRARQWESHLPLTVLRTENGGPGSARRCAIENVTSELVALVDADDIWLPNHLEELVRKWTRTGGIVTADAFYWDPKADVFVGTYRFRFPLPRLNQQRKAILQGNFVFLGSVFRRSDYFDAGGFRATRQVCGAEDWDLWIRMIRAGARVFGVDAPTYVYRLSVQGLTAGPSVIDRYVDVLSLALDEASNEQDRATIRQSIRWTRARRRLTEAYRCIECRDYARARRLAVHTLASRPRMVVEALAILAMPGTAGILHKSFRRTQTW